MAEFGMHNRESRFFRIWAEWVVSHRALVALVIIGTTAFLASRLGKLQMDSNPDLWAPQKHPYVQTTNLLDQVFGGRNYTVIGIVPKQGDIYQPEVLAKVKRIQDSLELSPHAVKHNVLSFAARKVKQVKGGPDGMEVRPIMEKVPQTPEEMQRFREAVQSMPFYVNALISPDGKAVAVVADFKQDASTPNFITLNHDLHDIVDRERDGSVDIYLGGLPIVGEAADRQFMKMPILRRGAVDHHAGSILVIPEFSGNAIADADRHFERYLECRRDGLPRCPSRPSKHHYPDPGDGRCGWARDPDIEAILRGIWTLAGGRIHRSAGESAGGS